MFTGIVELTGRVLAFGKKGLVYELTVQAGKIAETSALGDSISVDGVCLTVTKKSAEELTFQLQEETLRLTIAKNYTYGTIVNLERAITPQTRLGGHLVQGHIDCRVPVRSFHREGEDTVLRFQLPVEFLPFVVKKGFIAVNGVSVTLTEVLPECAIHLIPTTLANTNLQFLKTGSLINIETDILGKYVQAQIGKRA